MPYTENNINSSKNENINKDSQEKIEEFLQVRAVSYPNQKEIAPLLERIEEDKNWRKDKEFTGKIREYLKSQFQYWIDRSKKPAKDSNNYKNIYEEELTKLLKDLDNE